MQSQAIFDQYLGYGSKGLGIDSLREEIDKGNDVEEIETWLNKAFLNYQISPEILIDPVLYWGFDYKNSDNNILEYHIEEEYPLAYCLSFAKVLQLYFTGIFHVGIMIEFSILKNNVVIKIETIDSKIIRDLKIPRSSTIIDQFYKNDDLLNTVPPDNFYFSYLFTEENDKNLRYAFLFDKALDSLYHLNLCMFDDILSFVRGVFVLRHDKTNIVLQKNLEELEDFPEQHEKVLSLIDLIDG